MLSALKRLMKFFSISFSISCHLYGGEQNEKFLVYYNDKASFNNLSSYSLIVFDDEYHPSLLGYQETAQTILGYLSIGEVSKHRFYFSELQKRQLLLNENQNWEGSYLIDIRNPYFTQLLLETLIPKILHQGFHGIFIDTLDSSLDLENEFPLQYAGMKQAAVDVIKAIRLHYPSIKIMVNRAFELLNQIGNQINYILAESIYTTYDFKNKRANLVDTWIFESISSELQKQQKLFSHLKVYTLDYWDFNDVAQIKKIYKIQRNKGFIPYVSTIKLDTIMKEPL